MGGFVGTSVGSASPPQAVKSTPAVIIRINIRIVSLLVIASKFIGQILPLNAEI
jgi:hypothetical protein